MKCEITCAKCTERWRKMVGKYPGEHIKLVEGSALRDFICDGCGTPLPIGQTVHAMSLYTARTPYFSWEADFIAVKPPKDNGA